MTDTFCVQKLPTHKNLQFPNFNSSYVVKFRSVSWRRLTAHSNAGAFPVKKKFQFVLNICQWKSPSNVYEISRKWCATFHVTANLFVSDHAWYFRFMQLSGDFLSVLISFHQVSNCLLITLIFKVNVGPGIASRILNFRSFLVPKFLTRFLNLSCFWLQKLSLVFVKRASKLPRKISKLVVAAIKKVSKHSSKLHSVRTFLNSVRIKAANYKVS